MSNFSHSGKSMRQTPIGTGQGSIDNDRKVFLNQKKEEELNLLKTPNNNIDETNDRGTKKIESHIEANGIKIETTKHYFEYPKHIQEETGILGYYRTTISNENIIDFIKKSLQDQDTINLKDYGVTDTNSLDFTRNEAHRGFTHICYILLSSLSAGEYPRQCFTHQMNAYVDANIKEVYNKFFATNKFFIQKIYDIDLIKQMKEYGIREPFNHTPENYYRRSSATIFDKKTNNKISPNNIGFEEITESKYFDGIKNGELFACTPYTGFNVDTLQFYFPDLYNHNIYFGFSIKKNAFFYEYLDRALDIYASKLNGIDWEEIKIKKGIGSIIEELILMDSQVSEFIKNDMWVENEQLKAHFAEAIFNAIKKLELRHGMNIENCTGCKVDKFIEIIMRDCQLALHAKEYRKKGNTVELRLPVFMGLEEEIPQLRRGYATYAHFMNDKGLNFIEFKHADHLPTPTKE